MCSYLTFCNFLIYFVKKVKQEKVFEKNSLNAYEGFLYLEKNMSWHKLTTCIEI